MEGTSSNLERFSFSLKVLKVFPKIVYRIITNILPNNTTSSSFPSFKQWEQDRYIYFTDDKINVLNVPFFLRNHFPLNCNVHFFE